MKFTRMPIEVESPEEYGYDNIKNNLSESSCTDQTLESLNLPHIPNLTFLYNEHRGGGRLRELIIGNSDLQKDDVLITSGAAGALFIISTSQLTKDDHLLVMRPNYAMNLETPKAIGCDITYIDLTLESGFQPDISAVQRALKPNSKIVSITAPHNPTGTAISRETLDQFVALTKQSGCLLLVDETYRDISYTNPLPIASTLGDHVISVSSLSKSYGLPGIRIGWLITQNSKLQETFLAAKEQISISGSVFDEWVAKQALDRRDEILPSTNAEMRKRLAIVEAWIEKEDLLEWVRPEGGVVCFPHMKEEPIGGTKAFYQRLLLEHGTYVGPGHWFEMPDTFFRLGFGWPTLGQFENGLVAISKALRG